VSTGLALAKVLKARLTVVTVSEPWIAVVAGEMALGFPYEEYEKAAAESAASISTQWPRLPRNKGCSVRRCTSKSTSPPKASSTVPSTRDAT
jgi:hypothetical protein